MAGDDKNSHFSRNELFDLSGKVALVTGIPPVATRTHRR